MSSFAAFLHVQGVRYPLLTYSLTIYQETDSLGRPASPTQGGTIDCTLNVPTTDRSAILSWMLSPTTQLDGQIILMQDVPRTVLKSIAFFNAYCVGLTMQFRSGQSGGGSLQMQVRVSPQRVAVGAIVHDNNWPLESHGAGETFAKQNKAANEQIAQHDDLHNVLHAVGGIPLLGRVAAAADKALYLSEGDPMLGQSMSSRQGSFIGTAQFPYGTVGYGVHLSIGAIQEAASTLTGSPGFGEAAIGDLFNRADVQAMLAQENTYENNLKVAELEYNYWTDVLTDSDQSLANRIGGFAGVLFTPETRATIQMWATEVRHLPTEVIERIEQVKDLANRRLAQIKGEYSQF